MEKKIQEYLRDRGLTTTGNKEELVALAFSASYFFNCIEFIQHKHMYKVQQYIRFRY